MKKFFKFMSLALVAGALMVACNPDPENEGTDTTPETPNPPAPQVNHNIDITWEGVAQQLGYKNLTADDGQLNNGTIYMFEAARGLSNDDYEFPAFIFQFIASGGDFGHAAEWQIGQQGATGQDYFPTEAYIEGGISVGENVYGDWALNQITGGTETEAFDATANTITANLSTTFYDFAFYLDVYTRYQSGELTEDEANAELQNMTLKECTFSVNGYNL